MSKLLFKLNPNDKSTFEFETEDLPQDGDRLISEVKSLIERSLDIWSDLIIEKWVLNSNIKESIKNSYVIIG